MNSGSLITTRKKQEKRRSQRVALRFGTSRIALGLGLALSLCWLSQTHLAKAQVAEPADPQAERDRVLAEIDKAQHLMDDEKYSEAIEVLLPLSRSYYTNVGIQLMLGTAYMAQADATEDSTAALRLLQLSRTRLVAARTLAKGDKDMLSAVDSLMSVLQDELKALQADDDDTVPVITPPQPAPKPVAPKPGAKPVPKPVPKPVTKPAPKPVPPPVKPAPVPPVTEDEPDTPTNTTATGPLLATSAMTSNLPLNLPGPAIEPKTNDAAILAKEEKNRKYPTYTAYTDLAVTYTGLGMYNDAVRNYRTCAQLYRRAGNAETANIYEQYASRYENEVRLYVDRPLTNTEEDALYTHALLEPPVGTYVGAFIDRDDRLKDVWDSEYFQTHRNPNEFAKLVGKPHATFFMYASYGGQFPRLWLERCKEEGVIPQLAWEPQEGLDKVQENAYLIDFAKQCGSLKWPIFLRFASEMNGTWSKWSGNPELYKAKFRLVNKVFKQYAPQVATIWCVNNTPTDNIMDYYPGDDGCDWVGINLYSVPFYSENSLAKPGDLDSPSNFIRPIYDMFKDRKPIALCEYASSQMHAAENKPRIDFAVNKMSLLYGSLPRLFPRIKMVSWFDQNNIKYAREGRRINNFSLTENGIVLDAYRGLVNSPYFIEGGSSLNNNVAANMSRPVPCPVTVGQNVRGLTRFSIWVKTPVARPLVFLQIGDKLVYAGKRAGAHIIDIDTNQIPTGRWPVTVYVYSDAGKFVAKQTTTMAFGRTRGDDLNPVYVTGTVGDYYADRSGYITALSLQTMGTENYVHFTPEMGAQLQERFPVNGAFAAWIKPDPENGPGHWILVSLEEAKPSTPGRRTLPTDLNRLATEPVVAPDAAKTIIDGTLTGIVRDEHDEVLALELDHTTYVRVPESLRLVAPNGTAAEKKNAVVLKRAVLVRVTGQDETPVEGAVSAFKTRLVANEIEVDGRKASEVGLPLITVKQWREIAGQPKISRSKSKPTNALKAPEFQRYLMPQPRDGGAGPTRGGGLPPIIPPNVRPY